MRIELYSVSLSYDYCFHMTNPSVIVIANEKFQEWLCDDMRGWFEERLPRAEIKTEFIDFSHKQEVQVRYFIDVANDSLVVTEFLLRFK